MMQSRGIVEKVTRPKLSGIMAKGRLFGTHLYNVSVNSLWTSYVAPWML